ncbi:MAG: T9SS type A sorting domain-containing protein [Bacteroidales bacterium]|nr:T9SS type A sorting domain-containing protein [Bacteroidales bacterium]
MRTFLINSIFFLAASSLIAQTNPTPYSLSSGNYQFKQWDSLAVTGTYPANMVFQYVPSNRLGPFYNDSASDYSCPYNMSKRPRINGYMSKGIGILTTSSSQYNDCNSGTAEKRFMGSILLALNATNRANIKVQWKSETLVPGDGNGTPATPRIWNLRLQYRLGSSGNFQDVPGPVEFVASINTGDSAIIGPVTLPADCNNKPLVQLRWIYFESSAGSGGTRPRLRFDDLTIASDAWVGLEEPNAFKAQLFPNPTDHFFYFRSNSQHWDYLTVSDATGRNMLESEFTDGPIDCSYLQNGLYFIRIYSSTSQLLGTYKLLKN